MAVYSLAQAKDQLSRLVDEALTGEPVTITRHGKFAVVSLTPSVPAPKPLTDKYLAQMRLRRALRPRSGRRFCDFSS